MDNERFTDYYKLLGDAGNVDNGQDIMQQAQESASVWLKQHGMAS